MHYTGRVIINVTPYGFINYAADFLHAAEQFSTSDRFSPVPYYLLCHSIELSLKSFLVVKGVSKKELKEKYRHHLAKALTKACQLGIEQLAVITPEWRDNLAKADGYYSSKEFEYFEITKAATAYPDLPDLNALTGLASGLASKLRPFARDCSVKPHDRKDN